MPKTDKSYRRNLHVPVDGHIPPAVLEKNNRNRAWKYGYNEEYDMVIISRNGTVGQVISINTLLIALPKQPGRGIRFEKNKPENQKWVRYSCPDELQHFDRYYSGEKNIEAKINEVAVRNKKYIDRDYERIENGDWFWNDGEAVYIPGNYYFFLQWYFLPEDGMYPNFRMPQRDYFIWMEACMADLRCVGSLLLKSRRSAFTVSSTSLILRDAIRHYNSYYPIMADVEKHAKTIFSNYIVKTFNELPKHLQPQRVGEANPKSELRLDAAKKKFTTNSKISAEADGLGTVIAPTATTLNAYDSTRPRLSINDEIGKTIMDITEWWAVHKKCHLEGRTLKGKAICGSTANPPQSGGKPYQVLYEASKLTTRSKSGFTKSGLYALFIPADYAQTGYFDQWGYVVYESTDKPILRDNGEMMTQGAKDFLDEKEAQNAENLKMFNYEKRQDPRVDTDPFRDEDASNMYATESMINLINFLKEYKTTPKYKTLVYRFDLLWKNGLVDEEVEIHIHPKGRFMAYAPNGVLPIPKEMRNKHELRKGKKAPINGHIAAIGVDPFTSNRNQYGGSKQGLVGMTTDHHELAPNQKEMVFIYYNYRGTTFEEAVDDAIKCCVYFSIPALIERNKDSILKEFKRRGYRHFCMEDPLKNKSQLNYDDKFYGGIYTLNNVDKQESALISYIAKFPEDIVENDIKCPFLELNEHASEYTRENRKSKDDIVAWQLARLATNSELAGRKTTVVEETSDYDILSLFDNQQFEYN